MDKVEKLRMKLAIYSQTTKKGNLILNAMVIAQKEGKIFRKQIFQTGLISDSSVIENDPDQFGKEPVVCEDQNGRIITRKECLERSQSAPHFEQCRQCTVDKGTRGLLIYDLKTTAK